jgi:(p)ppGpp synthase/HD superfamily hydrolase
MEVREKAFYYGYLVHSNNPPRRYGNLPAFSHPLSVGELLESMGCDDNLVAAGYLHDVVEDNKDFKIKDIALEFGDDIGYLVFTASERIKKPISFANDEEKLIFWIKRKKRAINDIKTKPLRNKLLVCADKVHNIRCLIQEFTEKGREDWSLYTAKRDEQLWFFTSVYKSLVFNEDPNHPLFVMLREAIDELIELCHTTKRDIPKRMVLKKTA